MPFKTEMKWKSRRQIAKLRKQKAEKIKRKLNINKIVTNNHYEYDARNKELYLYAPANFSIIDNTEDTINYFNNILSLINSRNHYRIYINFALIYVTNPTIDAIMYVLALIKNSKKFYNAKGVYPIDKKAKNIFIKSGFLNYVASDFLNLNPDNDKNIQIKISSNSNDNRKHCKDINLILLNKYELKRKSLGFLYDILSEMMINTNEHAYNNTGFLLTNWYVYVSTEKNIVKFSFLDTGEGIPETVRNNYKEEVAKLNLENDSDIIIATLNGKLSEITNQKYRGKGLPKFTKYSRRQKISNFKIISGKGYVNYNTKKNQYKYTNLKQKLIGTVYYWEIDINKIKEESL